MQRARAEEEEEEEEIRSHVMQTRHKSSASGRKVFLQSVGK